MHQWKTSSGTRLSRLVLVTAGALALCALGAAPTQSCGPLPGGGLPDAGGGVHVCGDGRVTGMEQCDGVVPAGRTCETETAGYVNGTLRCDPIACILDARGCTLPVCGNGRAEGMEQCDGADLRGVTCPEGQVGKVTCDPEFCIVHRAACKLPTCGNGVQDPGEDCDGTDFSGHPCYVAPSDSPTTDPLKCLSNCTIEGGECYPQPPCADGRECDGPMTCQEYAVLTGWPADHYVSGRVPCDAESCMVTSTSQCALNHAHCGNGILEPEWGETCDGSDLGGATCQSAGFPFGSMRCSQSCQLATFSSCYGACIPMGRAFYCQ